MAGSIITKEIPIIDKNDSLYHAFKLMEKAGIDKAIVLENRVAEDGREEKELAGILTSRDIVEKLGTQRVRLMTASKLHASGVMSINPIYVAPDITLIEAAKLMDKHGIGILPVVEENTVEGAILRDTVIEAGSEDDTEIRFIMDTAPVTVHVSDRVLKAKQEMLSNDLSFLPVLDENDEIVGYITIYEVALSLVRFEDIVPPKYRKERIMHLLVEDVMRFRPPRLQITDSVSKAIVEMNRKHSRGAVVVDEIGRLAGVVTPHIILRHLLTDKPELLNRAG
jgi:CBS domain-containing protein